MTAPADRHDGGLPVAWLPLAAGLLVLFTIHAAWLVSAHFGHVAWCNPYLDSCTSISATGRQLPAKLFFKPLVTLGAVAAAVTWLLAAHWLALCGDGAVRTRRAMAVLGALAAVFLVGYTAGLGEGGDTARILRRVGVSLGFGCTFLCQVLLLARLSAWRGPAQVLRGVYPAMAFLVLLLFVLGFSSVFLAAFHPAYGRMDDAFEWWFALLLNLHFPLLALLWHRHGWHLHVRHGTGRQGASE
jgi:hypothetical protein